LKTFRQSSNLQSHLKRHAARANACSKNPTEAQDLVKDEDPIGAGDPVIDEDPIRDDNLVRAGYPLEAEDSEDPVKGEDPIEDENLIRAGYPLEAEDPVGAEGPASDEDEHPIKDENPKGAEHVVQVENSCEEESLNEDNNDKSEDRVEHELPDVQ
jgi:hypothetical protein